MLDVVILETAQGRDVRVDLADVAEELVAEPFVLRCAAHQPGDVDEGELRRDDLLAARDCRQFFQPRVGDRDVADIRLDRAEGIIGRLRRRGFGQRVERSEERRVGKECVSTGRSRWWAYP